ncbi:MAG: hypothetical protein EXQ52_00880 [Bryobacterales bacterium]|nr:hypothetical protein [Bryobacterales bacterium]
MAHTRLHQTHTVERYPSPPIWTGFVGRLQEFFAAVIAVGGRRVPVLLQRMIFRRQANALMFRQAMRFRRPQDSVFESGLKLTYSTASIAVVGGTWYSPIFG